MAFDLVAAGGYGSGTLGDVVYDSSNSGTIINSVAEVTAVNVGTTTTTLTIASEQTVDDCTFRAGSEVFLFSVCGSSDATQEDADNQGVWAIAAITSRSGNNIVVNKSLSDFAGLPTNNGYNLAVRIVTIPRYRNLTLETGASITPRAGYPLVLKCSGTLTLNGGDINLKDKGGSIVLEHPPTQNQHGILDTYKYSGWENSRLKDHFYPLYGDGAAFIIAKSLVIANNTSRIGNPSTYGRQFCRGSAGSYFDSVSNVATNLGGSNIVLVAGTITGFTPKIIARYRSLTAEEKAAGRIHTFYNQLGACYIASNTRLTNDEGLYAYDCISDPSRLANMGVRDFGDGSAGSATNPARQNNYVVVSAIDSTTRKTLTIGTPSTNGAIAFEAGTLVMIHFNHIDYNNTKFSGRFIIARITAISGSTVAVDTSVPTQLVNNFSNYYCQMISIPQFENFTLDETFSDVPKFKSTSAAQGGIFAIAVNGTCDLRGGKINVEGRGGGKPYQSQGLQYIGNAQNSNKLPIGEGHGSVFILARNLIMDTSTRIGATYSGARGDNQTTGSVGSWPFGGSGYQGTHGGGYLGEPIHQDTSIGQGGWGGGGGRHAETRLVGRGGYGSNGSCSDSAISSTLDPKNGLQGAHIMIIADTITGFNQIAISTGGQGGSPGSAGYGGGAEGATASGNTFASGAGGYNGGGGCPWGAALTALPKPGGSSGWAFIYCNNAIDQNTHDTIL